MITVHEGQELVFKHVPLLKTEVRTLDKCSGRILASNICSPVNLPPFDQSAMDGYALRVKDIQEQEKSRLVIGEIPAGKYSGKIRLNELTAVKIFTGSHMPAGSDTVWIKENTVQKGVTVHYNGTPPLAGANVRPKGSHVKKGEKVLPAGCQLTAGLIGLAAAMGIQKLEVFRKPRVSLIITGSELVRAGSMLSKAGVYESNSTTINAALEESGFARGKVSICPDKIKAIRSAIRRSMKGNDLLLISGGISAGDYDLVRSALDSLGVNCIFHKIAQKPGKPLYFGKLGDKVVFALPGNPAAALICFYEYVLPALRRMSGYMHPRLNRLVLPLKNGITKKKGIAVFLKARVESGEVTVLEGQESFLLKPFLRANALAYIPAEQEELKAGHLTEVDIIPT